MEKKFIRMFCEEFKVHFPGLEKLKKFEKWQLWIFFFFSFFGQSDSKCFKLECENHETVARERNLAGDSGKRRS